MIPCANVSQSPPRSLPGTAGPEYGTASTAETVLIGPRYGKAAPEESPCRSPVSRSLRCGALRYGRVENMRRAAPAVLITLAFVVGCGKPNLVAIDRPSRPLYICPGEGRCSHPFDARRLLGLEMPAAEAAAKLHDLTVRPTKIDGRGVIITMDFETNRIDVALQHKIIVKILHRG